MAFGPLQPALLGPAAIAVHDDGNVTRKVGALDPGGHDSNLHRGAPRSTGGRYDRPPCAGPPSRTRPPAGAAPASSSRASPTRSRPPTSTPTFGCPRTSTTRCASPAPRSTTGAPSPRAAVTAP